MREGVSWYGSGGRGVREGLSWYGSGGRGIAKKMVTLLIDEARNRGVTEISLDATAEGRPLYYDLGFTDSDECMVLVLS
ncbi:MAG: GNAT family N-acetyltransferase [Eubacterium sp.]|nr:GNAT family N-acetyltransferase [Eubacterium sp.]